jgi:hypothetical protein
MGEGAEILDHQAPAQQPAAGSSAPPPPYKDLSIRVGDRRRRRDGGARLLRQRGSSDPRSLVGARTPAALGGSFDSRIGILLQNAVKMC